MKVAAALGACALLACAAAAAETAHPGWRNLTTGGPMRAGIYGRIEVRPGAEPPPLVFDRPLVAQAPDRPGEARPVYLYVPPGQLRRWAQHCDKWKACGRPVYFVRVDDSPSRLGGWKKSQRLQPQVSFSWSALERD